MAINISISFYRKKKCSSVMVLSIGCDIARFYILLLSFLLRVAQCFAMDYQRGVLKDPNQLAQTISSNIQKITQQSKCTRHSDLIVLI